MERQAANDDDERLAATLRENVQLGRRVDELEKALHHAYATAADERHHAAQRHAALADKALALKGDADEWSAQSATHADALDALKSEHAAQREQWAAELAAATRDFESMRGQLVQPADLEAMRVRLVADAEAPLRARGAELEAELEAARRERSSAVRDADKRRADLEAARVEHAAELRAAQAEYDTGLADARAKLEIAQAEARAAADVSERGKRAARDKAEMASRFERMLEELGDLRAENAALRQQRDDFGPEAAVRRGEQNAAERTLAAVRFGLDRRVANLQAELDAAAASHERVHAENLRLQRELRAARVAADDAAHKLSAAALASAAVEPEAKHELGRLRLEMERRQNEAGRREAALLRSRDELATALVGAQSDAAEALARARDEASERVRRVEADAAASRADVARLQAEAAEHAAASRERATALLADAAQCRAELHAAQLERATAADEAARQKRRADEAVDELESAASQARGARKAAADADAKVLALERADGLASAAQERLMEQLAKSAERIDAVRAEARSAQHALVAKVKAAKQTWAKERKALRKSDAERSRQVLALRTRLEQTRAGGGEALGALSAVAESAEQLRGIVKNEEVVHAELREMKRSLLQAAS
jgi:hypothetical protein